jgi:excisionase family DNA binding protein
MTRPRGTDSSRTRTGGRQRLPRPIDHTPDRHDTAPGTHALAGHGQADLISSAGREAIAQSVALEAIARALIGLLITTEPEQPARHTENTPLLDVEETAELLRVSRMTVTRLVDEGQLPSVTVRKGKAHKLRRIPRAFIDRMLADANAGAQVDMEVYAAAWLAEQAQRHEPQGNAGTLSRKRAT